MSIPLIGSNRWPLLAGRDDMVDVDDTGASDSALIIFERPAGKGCAGEGCVVELEGVCETMSLIVGCRDCMVGVAPTVGVSASFCFLRAEAEPSGLDVRGFRGFFSFAFSSPFGVPTTAFGSFFLRGFLTFSVLGVVVFLAFCAFWVEVDELEASGFENIKGLELTTIVSATPRLPFVCGEGTGDRDESELSSRTLPSIFENQFYNIDSRSRI